MFKVTVIEKVLGEVVVSIYGLPTLDQMLRFKQMCEEDNCLVIVHEGSEKTLYAV